MSDAAALLRVPALPKLKLSAAALLLGAGVAALAWRLAPGPGPAVLFGLVTTLATYTLIVLSEAGAAIRFAQIAAGLGALLALAAVKAAPDRVVGVLEFGSLGFLAYGASRSLATRKFAWPLGWKIAIAAALLAALVAFNIFYVTASRDLMIADFMFYRLVSIAVATLLRAGKTLSLLLDLAGSMPKDYSWAPAILPGVALAAFGPLSRAVYQGATLLFYATPAALALGWLARELARRAGASAHAMGAPVAFAFALAAIAAAYPFGLTVAARGMPDIGGLALDVLSLNLADRLLRALAAPGERAAAPARKLAFALALALFALFLFRRWYAFAALALLVATGAEFTAIAWRGRLSFGWRKSALAGATGALTLLALLAPVLADWMRDPASHDYARLYAAYRKTPAALAGAVGDWCGFVPLALALIGAAFVLLRSGGRGRLARLTVGAAALAALMFLRVQSPYPHHLYLLTPAVAGFIAAPLLILLARTSAAWLPLGALAALTFTPAGALAPKGLFPAAAWPPSPRADLAELARLKEWVDARARPDNKVCGLGSSYTFSGQLIDELWQLKSDKSPLAGPSQAVSVPMTDVDTVDGPPKTAIKDCKYLLVGDPVQTHVIPSYQLTVTLPANELLAGSGIGEHYLRTGEIFHLQHDVSVIAFEQITPLDDADMTKLAERWRVARAEAEAGGR